MKITILNGNPETHNEAFDAYITSLTVALAAEQHEVELLTLREMDIKYCVGCFGCQLLVTHVFTGGDKAYLNNRISFGHLLFFLARSGVRTISRATGSLLFA